MNLPWLKITAGPLLFVICLLIGDAGHEQVRMLGVILWMLSWWITSAIPIGATSLLPIVLFPLLGILDMTSTTVNYANPIIFLFFGGFVLGLAIEKWGLHRRIALNILHLSGEKPKRIILGSMLATALLSMWISNTATTVMMLPIGVSLLTFLKDKMPQPSAMRNFGLTLMLGIAYAANIGGIATLIGTPPNLVLAGILKESGMPELTFANWLFFALPLVILLFVIVYFLNTSVIFPVKISRIGGIGDLIKNELQQLGKMRQGEMRVLIVMVGTALLWIFRSQLTQIFFLKDLSDTIIAIAASVLLFTLSSGEQKGARLLVWEDTKKMPWDILYLFGGGISLAKGMEATEMVDLAGDFINTSGVVTPILVILMICAFAVFLTEVMSNVALVSVFIPVSLVIAQNLGLPELQLALPLTIGASCAFMFPIATPPNAIVFSSGYIRMNEMARIGMVLNVVCILVISFYCWLMQEFFF